MLTALDSVLAFDFVWPEVVVRSPHVFDAVIAGVTAFLWAHQGWQGPLDLQPAQSAATSEAVTPDPLRAAIAGLEDRWLEDGWIWAPPAPGGGRV
ncbi:hypothetical protein OV079_08545 [Nannocystis pusilla]|uniref:Uncharacterized protein n=1 Tax=Nannocystis pusilla TaxID=889268 RepID=A0A9X3EKZ5_9BACT|nr:hypothetical protein [Nannocystis pusilla]MCY1005615.1 hypothetical protein [Nannocystis pusilla]